jgi:hypothetical protein
VLEQLFLLLLLERLANEVEPSQDQLVLAEATNKLKCFHEGVFTFQTIFIKCQGISSFAQVGPVLGFEFGLLLEQVDVVLDRVQGLVADEFAVSDDDLVLLLDREELEHVLDAVVEHVSCNRLHLLLKEFAKYSVCVI